MAVSADSTVRARVDSATKRKASKALENMGLSVSDAIRLLLARVAQEKRLPFETKIPNAATKKAIDELEQGKGKRFSGVEDLLEDLDAED